MNARLAEHRGGRERLKVLVISRAYPNDVLPQLGPWAEALTRHIAEECDVRVVSPVPWCPPLPRVRSLEQYTRFRDVPRHEVRNGIPSVHPRIALGPGRSLYRTEGRSFELGIRRAVERIHAEFPFDLIHAHFIYPDGVAAYRLGRRYGVPFAVTEHAPWYPWLSMPAIGSQALPAARAAALLVPVSEAVSATMQRFGIDPARIRILPEGVDVELFRPGSAAHRDPNQILHVGFINFNKGVDLLLQAMRIILARRPEARLLLVGGSHYRDTRIQEEKLRAMARDLGLGDHVSFLGMRPQHELPVHMRASGVMVLASRAEAFGTVLAEAISCGTPVVATRCGGPEDYVTPEVGHLVPSEDPRSLADAILDVLDHPERYDPQRLHAFVGERFSWRSVAARHVEEFQNVVVEWPHAADKRART
jgi:glycosyltransferase involved in cell wall biosynthesis